MSDLIDRQVAIDALAKVAREKFNLSDEFNHYLAGLMDGDYAIRQLPSAQPEHKTGHWTNIRISARGTSTAECSLCGATVHTNFTDVVNFCPNCGCRMDGGEI